MWSFRNICSTACCRCSTSPHHPFSKHCFCQPTLRRKTSEFLHRYLSYNKCHRYERAEYSTIALNLDIWLAVHHNITFLLLPTWYTNFLFIYTNYIKLNSSTCFERIPSIIRRSTMQIVHTQPLVSSLAANDCLVQPLRKSVLSGCTRQSLAESDDTRGCIGTICVVDLLMMGGNALKTCRRI